MANLGQPAVQASDVSTASVTSTSSSKISMFRAKAGFVIPKNKLSGSLVPTFKGVNKPEGSDAANDQSIKQMVQKTRWGTDLTQDASVRRGRALAYQTRVEQITRQLKSGLVEGENDQSNRLEENASDHGLSSSQTRNQEKMRHLEHEKQEAIGEILKLNPSYKAPSDYKPLMKEDFVSLPVKEHAGYNFVGLVFGPDNDTQKQLEKETGARIRVYGAKSKTGEKVELKASDGNQVFSACDEMHVQISADSYEKIDSAIGLIELLISSILVKLAASNGSTSTSGDDVVLSKAEDTDSVPVTSAAVQNQVIESPGVIPLPNPQGQVQPYRAPWVPTGPRHLTSSLPPVDAMTASSSFSFNSPSMASMIGPRVVPPTGVGSGPPAIPSVSPMSQPSMQAFQRPLMPQLQYLAPIGFPSPRNPATHLPSVQPISNPAPFAGHQLPVVQPRPAGSLAPTPQNPIANVPLGGQSSPAGSSMGWAAPPVGPLPHRPGSMVQVTPHVAVAHGPHPMSSQPMIPAIPPASAPIVSAAPIVPQGLSSASPMIPGQLYGPPFISQIRSSSALHVQPFAPQGPVSNMSLSTPLGPVSVHPPQSGITNSLLPPVRPPSFTPLNSMTGVAPRPQQPSAGDFTFQPHRPPALPPSVLDHGAGSQWPPQSGGPSLITPPPALGTPPFRPTVQSASPLSIYTRPPFINQMGQQAPVSPISFGGNTSTFGNSMIPQLGPRNPGPVPQLPNAGAPYPPPRPGPGSSFQFQPSMRPPNIMAANQGFRNNVTPTAVTPMASTISSGGQLQVYDPFSPTSVAASARLHGMNPPPPVGKQDNDPEYEDLMASVGVK